MRIGTIDLDHPILLAPMEDVTDRAFRLLCKRMGADLVYTEFVPAEAIVRRVATSLEKLDFSEEERPFGIQIFGNRVEGMVGAARAAAAHQPDLLDINFGCPVKKVASGDRSSCAGSGLLRYPDVMEELARAVVEAMRPFGIPVTVKTRLGWDAGSISVYDTIERMERAGVGAITFHARTREQMFKGRANWSWIRRAKEAASVPIIGNGDVRSPEDVARMFDETGTDGVMIGRSAIGNPFIFRRSKMFLRTGIVPPEPGVEERVAVYLEHLALAYRFKGRRAIRQLRKHVKGYVRDYSGASKLRARIMEIDEYEPLRELLLREFPALRSRSGLPEGGALEARAVAPTPLS